MNASVSIRRLGRTDVKLMRSLNALFGTAFRDYETYNEAPPEDGYLSGLLTKEHVIVLIAVTAGRVVGGLVAYELDKFERARRELYIYDLAVEEDHRRQGIATALIDHLRDIAAQRAACTMYVQADRGDAAAVALYGALGIRKDVMHFDMPITGICRRSDPELQPPSL